MRSPFRLIVGPILILALASPGFSATDNGRPDAVTGRWYSKAQADRGEALFTANCAACHGARGQGQPGWEERDESGYYPAPPLDGTGHSSHHPLRQMLRILNTGGGPMGGTMPSFADVLKEPDMRAVLAFVQSLWAPETYETWTALPED